MTITALTAQAVAELVGGRLLGQGNTPLHRVAALDRAGPDDLSLLSSTKYLREFRTSQAGAVITIADLASEPEGPATRIVVDDPARALMAIARHLEPESTHRAGVHPTAILGRGVSLGEGTSIGPHTVVGDAVRIGTGCRLGPGVILEDGVIVGDQCSLEARVVCLQGARLGNRVLVQAGAIIGGTGFGFSSSPEGHQRIPHLGACIIEDDVEIGSSTCIDRGSVDDTVIGRGTKIDNLVQIAHNVRIGEHCFIAAGVGIGGSCRIGNEVILAGQAGLAGHLSIGDRARIAAQSGLAQNIPAGADYSGSPARPHRDNMRGQAAMLRLGRLMRELEAMVQERVDRG